MSQCHALKLDISQPGQGEFVRFYQEVTRLGDLDTCAILADGKEDAIVDSKRCEQKRQHWKSMGSGDIDDNLPIHLNKHHAIRER
jgi:hypothetical protein